MVPTLIFVWLLACMIKSSALTPTHISDTTKLKIGESSSALDKLQAKLDKTVYRWKITTRQQDELRAKIKTRLETLNKDIEDIKHHSYLSDDEKVAVRHNHVNAVDAESGSSANQDYSEEDDMVEKQTRKGVMQMFKFGDADIESRLKQLVDSAPADPSSSSDSIPHSDDDVEDDSIPHNDDDIEEDLEPPAVLSPPDRPMLNQIVKNTPDVSSSSSSSSSSLDSIPLSEDDIEEDAIPHNDDDIEEDLESPAALSPLGKPMLNQIVKNIREDSKKYLESVAHTDDDLEDILEPASAAHVGSRLNQIVTGTHDGLASSLDSMAQSEDDIEPDDESIQSQSLDRIPQNMPEDLAQSDEDLELDS